MFKYETHMHTAEASACAHSSGAEMAEKYKSEGYTGIIVTDHFFNGNTAVPEYLPWRERVMLFCTGYENALKRGRQIGLDVFFGFEYGDGCSDFLVYGLDKEWLLRNDDIMSMKTEEFLAYARSCGGRVIQAHPFRRRDYIYATLHAPRLCDGVEAVNASHDDPEINERARIYAGWYDLPVTAGSDAHDTSSWFFGGGVLSERRFSSAKDYADAVIQRRVICLDRGGRQECEK